MDVPRQSPYLIKPPPTRVRLGAFELELNSGELFSGGDKVVLQEQPLQILRILIEANGEVVSRDAIRSRLWPDDTVVEFDHSINTAIRNLRRALDDTAQEPSYIETIARRGYRLMVPVEAVLNRVVLVPRTLPGEPAKEKPGEPPEPRPTPIEFHERDILKFLRRPSFLVASVLGLIAVSAIGWRLLYRDLTPKRVATERQITFAPLEDRVTGGGVSPNGKFVAWHDLTGVYVRSIDSGETHPVRLPAELSKRLFSLHWFPGGDKLIADAASPEGWDVWEINLLGDAEPKLVFRNGVDPVVSPDGQTIAYSNSEYNKIWRSIWLGPTNGDASRKFVDAQPDDRVMYPTWSPDGRWLAYVRRIKTDAAIVVRSVASGAESAIVTDSALPSPYKLTLYDIGALAWCGDGRLVFAVGYREARLSPRTHSSLWQVPVDLKSGRAVRGPARLTADSDGVLIYLTCTASSERLSVVRGREWPDVYIGDLSPGGNSINPPRRLTLDNRGSGINAWTRDSRAVLFSSERNGTSKIFRQAIDSNAAELVVQGPGEVSDTDVSPDGRWLLYRETESKGESAGAASSVSWLMRKSAAGGAPDRLLQIADVEEFQCAYDVKAVLPCVLSHTDSARIAFYALDPLQGKGRQLAEFQYTSAKRGNEWSVSPDGSQVALLDFDPKGFRIVIFSTSDGSSKHVVLDPVAGKPQSISWAADGKGFYVSSRGTDSFDLLYVTMAGEAHTLWRTNKRQWVINPIPSPDGKHLAFAAQSLDYNIWLIDNF